MKKGLGKVDRIKRGLASAMLLTTMAVQVAPIATVVNAESIRYEHEGVDIYKTSETGQYVVDIQPMIGAGNVGQGDATPHGGSYKIQQIAQYKSSGEGEDITGQEQIVRLTPDGINNINVDSDGEYQITPVDRIPGYKTDLGATKIEDEFGEVIDVDPQGYYLYTFPLIDNGVPSEDQVVRFQPKLREARTSLEVEKIGDDQETPLEDVAFTVYKTYDAQTDEDTSNNPVKIETAKTDEEGKIVFEDLIEGSYYFVEEVSTVPNLYLPDERKVEFDVEVDEAGEDVYIVATDESDVTTVGDNMRGKITNKKTITRFNYIDLAQNKEESYISVQSDYVGKGHDEERINTTQGQATGENEGVVYVNTNGVVEFSSSVDIPRNFNDYETLEVTNTISDKLTIDSSTIELRILGRDKLVGTYNLDNGALVHDGQTITLNAKHEAIKDILEDGSNKSDYLVLTFNASVDTNSILENVQHEKLTSTQTIVSDTGMTDGEVETKTTVHETEVRVREGRLVVNKHEHDGKDTPLAGAEFQLYQVAEEGIEGELSSHGREWVKASNPRGENANYFGTSDEEGIIVFENLPYGDYLLVETRSPEGFRINRDHKLIEFNDENEEVIEAEDGNTVTQIVKNMRRSQILPGTGTMGNIITIIALAATGVMLVIVTVKKKEEDEDTETATE